MFAPRSEILEDLGNASSAMPTISHSRAEAVAGAVSEAVSEIDAAAESDDPADSDYVPSSDSEADDDDREFDENVVTEPEDDEPGTEPEDDILTDGDYESEEEAKIVARKAVARANAKKRMGVAPIRMKRADLMTSTEFQQRFETIVAKVSQRADVSDYSGGLNAPRRHSRAPYNSPQIRPVVSSANSLNAEDMRTVEALMNLSGGGGGGSAPRMDVFEIPPAATAATTPQRRSARINSNPNPK